MTNPPVIAALLSYGMSGELFHAPFLEVHPGFKWKSVVERSKQKVQLRYPHVASVKTIEEVLQDHEVELVVVNTPNETHYAYTKAALNAGKHVVVEKPFTVATAEADELIALAQSKNRILTVFQSRRFDGDFRTIQRAIRENWVGPIAEFEAHYDRFRNYVEPNSWKEEIKPGTGILYNLGSHMLDQVLVLFGMPDELDARIAVQRPGGKVDDYYDIRLTYPEFRVIVKSSYLVREPGPRYVLHGVEGSFVKYGIDPQEEALKEGRLPNSPEWGMEEPSGWGKLNTTIDGEHVQRKMQTMRGNYMDFYQNVYEAIRENKPLAVRAEEARNVIYLIEACYKSNAQKKTIKL